MPVHRREAWRSWGRVVDPRKHQRPGFEDRATVRGYRARGARLTRFRAAIAAWARGFVPHSRTVVPM